MQQKMTKDKDYPHLHNGALTTFDAPLKKKANKTTKRLTPPHLNEFPNLSISHHT